MHFKGHIITKKIPTEEELNKILEPYYYENSTGEFDYDWKQIGGRFGGQIKIKFNLTDNEDNWYCFRERNHKYFINSVLDEIKEKADRYYEELDYMKYMGLNENILYVDGGYYNNMINFDITDSYLVIDDEENLYIKENWTDNEFKDNNEYEEQLKKIDLKDKFITIIDFHC